MIKIKHQYFSTVRSRLSEDEDVWSASVLWPPHAAGPHDPDAAQHQHRDQSHFWGNSYISSLRLSFHFRLSDWSEGGVSLKHLFLAVSDVLWVCVAAVRQNLSTWRWNTSLLKTKTHTAALSDAVFTDDSYPLSLCVQASLLSATCATFIRTLEECMTLAGQRLSPDLRPPERVTSTFWTHDMNVCLHIALNCDDHQSPDARRLK